MSDRPSLILPFLIDQFEEIQEVHSKSDIYYPGYGYGCSGCVGGTYPCKTRKLADEAIAATQ